MKYHYKPSFERTIKGLHPERRAKVKEAIQALVIFFETGQRTEGLGLKKLKREFWEIRTDLRDRILFRLRHNVLEFVLCGNHDEIRRYLKSI